MKISLRWLDVLVVLVVPVVLFSLSSACTRPNSDVGEGDTDDETSAGTTQGPSTTASSSEPTSTAGPTTAGMESGTTDPVDDSTGIDDTCEDAGFRCVDVPEGWNGPLARLADDAAPDTPSCGGEFPLSVWSGFGAVTDPGLACDCDCGDPTGGACSSNVLVDVYDVDCTPPTCNSLNLGGCNFLAKNWDSVSIGQAGSHTFVDQEDGGIRLIASAPVVEASPTCAEEVEVDIPEVEPADHRELCGSNEALDETCPADQTCAATPSNPYMPGVCIWADGDQPCPEELGYTVRELLHAAYEDTRACSECTCGSAQSVSCDGEVSVVAVYSEGGFVIDPAEYADADGTCSPRFIENGDPIAGVNFVLDYEAQDPTSSGCNPSGGEASGEVAPIDTITVCCTED